MSRVLVFLSSLLVVFSVAAVAGTIEGRVSGAKPGAVVYVEAAPGQIQHGTSKHFVMDQKNMQFVPHELMVPVGSTVTFENHDNTAHNVMWPSVGGDKKLGHNLGTFPPEHSVSYTFDHPGKVPVLCNIHSEMSAYIIVTPSPYASTVKPDGSYKIDNVPNGSYKVAVLGESNKKEEKSVTVAGATTVNFSMQ